MGEITIKLGVGVVGEVEPAPKSSLPEIDRGSGTVYTARTFIHGPRPMLISEAVNVVIPGGGRTPDGENSSPAGEQRALTGASFYAAYRLAGKVACSGDRSPADHPGGRPEATSLRRFVLSRRVRRNIADMYGPDRAPDAEHVEEEILSIDSITNLARLEAGGFLGPEGVPAAFSTQAKQAYRIVRVIGPKVLRRPFICVVAPEAEPEAPQSHASTIKRLADKLIAPIVEVGQTAFSMAILACINTDKYDAQALLVEVERRVRLGWKAILQVRTAVNKVTKLKIGIPGYTNQ